MASAPEAPAVATRSNRVVADLDPDLARRLRTWAGMRGQHVSHVLLELIGQAVPTAEQLADLMRNGGSHGHPDR
jgi:hypothetical protein